MYSYEFLESTDPGPESLSEFSGGKSQWPKQPTRPLAGLGRSHPTLISPSRTFKLGSMGPGSGLQDSLGSQQVR